MLTTECIPGVGPAHWTICSLLHCAAALRPPPISCMSSDPAQQSPNCTHWPRSLAP